MRSYKEIKALAKELYLKHERGAKVKDLADEYSISKPYASALIRKYARGAFDCDVNKSVTDEVINDQDKGIIDFIEKNKDDYQDTAEDCEPGDLLIRVAVDGPTSAGIVKLNLNGKEKPDSDSESSFLQLTASINCPATGDGFEFEIEIPTEHTELDIQKAIIEQLEWSVGTKPFTVF